MRMVIPTFTLALIIVMAVGCQSPTHQPIEMAPQRSHQGVVSDFDALRAEWEEQGDAGDLVNVAMLYTEDAVWVDVYGVVHSGWGAIQEAFEEAFAAIPTSGSKRRAP